MDKAELDRSVAEWNAKMAQSDAPRPPNTALIANIIRGLAPTIHELQMQIEALSARVTELERSQRVYLGIWREREYSQCSEVTHDGARWYCNKRTTDRPGSSADWVMMEKSSNPRTDTLPARPRQNGHVANPRRL